MEFQLLGPVEATLEGRRVELGATKQRALLAMLALDANAAVPVDRLVDGLWGDDPPATAAKMVQLYVSRLRRVFADAGAEIVTHGRGYELRADARSIDAVRFERLVEQAGNGGGDAREALALWRGPPLADVADEPFAAAQIRRLEGLRLRAAELAVEADLAAGREQAALTAGSSACSRSIRSTSGCTRCGSWRCTAAVASRMRSRPTATRASVLVEEIGIEPGPELRRLHDAVLSPGPGAVRAAAVKRVAEPLPSAEPPVRRRRRRGASPRWSLVASAAGVRLRALDRARLAAGHRRRHGRPDRRRRAARSRPSTPSVTIPRALATARGLDVGAEHRRQHGLAHRDRQRTRSP